MKTDPCLALSTRNATGGDDAHNLTTSSRRSNIGRRISSLAAAAVCLSLLAFPAIKAHAAAGTTTSLSVYPSSSVVVGTTVEVEAVVQSGGTNLPFGVVQFCDASAPACIGTALLGQAELTNAPVAGTAAVWLRLGIGTHKIKAVFLPQTNYAGSKSAISTLTVTGNRKTTTTLASTGTAGNYSLTATVSSASRIAPTGPVAFKDATSSNFQLGTADLAAPTPTHYALSSLPLQFVGLGPSTEAVADFNLDGIPDVAVVNATSGSVQILYGDGHGSSNYSYQISVPSATGITVGDFNGDGIPDMAVTASSVNEVYILQVAADKSFGIVASQAVAEFPNGIAAGDFNGDGTLDLVVSHGDGRDGTGISFLAGTGFGTLDPPSFVPVSESLSSIAVADFNGDGKLDFAVGGYGLVRIFLGNGDSTFTQSQALYAGVVPDSIAVADFNGDGHIDLAAISPLGKLLTVFLNDGTGTLFQEGTYTTGPYTGFANLTIGDFDGNGHDDIAYVTSVSAFEMGGTHSTIGILKGKGDGTFTAIAGAATGADPLGLAAADWNGDGLVDLVVANSSDGDVQLFKSAVTTSATAAVGPVSVPGGGTLQVFASYAANAGQGSSTSSNLALQGSPIVTATTLTVSPASPVYSGQTLQFTAVVSSTTNSNLIATGSVQFLNGAMVLATVSIASGQAVYSTNSLPVGTDSVKAVYSGDTNFVTSTSTPVSVTIKPPQAATPTFTPAPGSYTGAQSITIKDTTPGYGIYYTLDGTTPTTSSPKYSGPVTVSATTTIKAIATAKNYSTSPVAVGTYTIH